MSRSQPNENIPNPSLRWYEWMGAEGGLTYFDKEKKEKVKLPPNLTFIVLDQLATVKGWHDASDSGIYSNEVRDTTKDVMLVKAFKGGEIASGLYKDIKDKIAANGGHFVTNIYCAVKIDGELKIASLQFKGASLNSWIEFAKANRAELMKKAVTIVSVADGQKGAVKFKTPVFQLQDIKEQTENIAVALDVEFQKYLKQYLSKNVSSQVENVPPVTDGVDMEAKYYPDEPPSDHIPGKIEPNKKPVTQETYQEENPGLPF